MHFKDKLLGLDSTIIDLSKMDMPVLTFEGNMGDEREFDEARTARLIDLLVTETLGLKRVA